MKLNMKNLKCRKKYIRFTYFPRLYEVSIKKRRIFPFFSFLYYHQENLINIVFRQCFYYFVFQRIVWIVRECNNEENL